MGDAMGWRLQQFGASRFPLLEDLFNTPAKFVVLRDWFQTTFGNETDDEPSYALGDICGVVFDQAVLATALDIDETDRFDHAKNRAWQLLLRAEYRARGRRAHKALIERAITEVLGDKNQQKTMRLTFVPTGYAPPQIVRHGNHVEITIYRRPG
jgi:GNAT superfamily N-acetyltransferase